MLMPNDLLNDTLRRETLVNTLQATLAAHRATFAEAAEAFADLMATAHSPHITQEDEHFLDMAADLARATARVLPPALAIPRLTGARKEASQ